MATKSHGFELESAKVEWVRAHEMLSRLARTRAAADAEEGRWLLAALRSAAHVHLGFGSFSEYVERLFGYTPRSTQEKLRVAEALEELPRIANALARGELNWSAVRELTRVAVASTQSDWLQAARGKTVHQLEALVAGKLPGDTPASPTTLAARRHVLRFEVAAETLCLFRETLQKLRRNSATPLDDDAALLLMARQVLAGPGDEGRASYQIALSLCPACGQGRQQASGELVPVGADVVAMADCDGQHLGLIQTPAENEEVSSHESTHTRASVGPEHGVFESAHTGASVGAEHNVFESAHTGASVGTEHNVFESAHTGASVGTEHNAFESAHMGASVGAEHNAFESAVASATVVDHASHSDALCVAGAPARANANGRTSPVAADHSCKDAHTAASRVSPVIARSPARPRIVARVRCAHTTAVPTGSHELQRAKQTIPPAMRRAVLRRDQRCCAAPGCRNSRYLDIHHIRPRSEGGCTDADNLITLCGAHHRAVHRGELEITGSIGIGVCFRHADGNGYGQAVDSRAVETHVKAFAALRRLGFREAETRRVLAQISANHEPREKDLERVLREALAKLTTPATDPPGPAS